VKEEVPARGAHYVNARGLGGMLTNFNTNRTRIDRLAQLRAMQEGRHLRTPGQGGCAKLFLEIEKLEKFLSASSP
jgi:small subunit ribosomal protein S2